MYQKDESGVPFVKIIQDNGAKVNIFSFQTIVDVGIVQEEKVPIE